MKQLIFLVDFENNPSASNAFVAEELAEALERSYNVEVKYLKQGSTWYSPRSLYGVDILIAMKEDYELPLAHKAVPRDPVGYGYHSQSRSGAKSTLFSIAWMLNSYDKWLSKPWIGNYDLILTGSMLGKDFYDKISTSIGLQVQCFMSCPTPSFSSYLAPEGSRVAQRFTETIELISRRSYVPVEVLRLATDNLKFAPLMVEDVAPPMSSRTKDTIEAETNHTIEESDTNQRIDYLFTGSYRDDRELLKFNPSMLPQWKGMFVGDGWDKVNLSSSWRSATIAREKSYRDMPTLYQSAKIIVDDCDETTKPWAGVTSRVFNGLATGKLVLTNGRLGMEEIFTADLMIPFVIPTYSSGSELAALLDYYLMNDLEREKLVEKMRSIVLTRHTYQHRANEFQILLNSFGFEISTKHEELLRQIGSDKLIFGIDEDSQTEMSRKDTIKVGKVKENKSKEMLEMVKADYFDIAWSESMCIGISVTEDDQLYLKQLLSSLGTQYTRSKYYRQIDMKIFVMDSDKSSPSFQGFLKEAADSMNKEFDKGMVSVLSEEVVMVNGYYGNTPRANKNKLLGLDVMDTLLDHITAMASVHHHLRVTRSYHDDSPDEAFGTAQQTHSSCNWVMLTHGNAIYNETWFETVSRCYINKFHDILAFSISF